MVALARLCAFLVACRCRSLHTGRKWDQQLLSVSVRMTKRDLQCHIGCAARHITFELKLKEGHLGTHSPEPVPGIVWPTEVQMLLQRVPSAWTPCSHCTVRPAVPSS